jgi:hypothetical protein
VTPPVKRALVLVALAIGALALSALIGAAAISEDGCVSMLSGRGCV